MLGNLVLLQLSLFYGSIKGRLHRYVLLALSEYFWGIVTTIISHSNHFANLPSTVSQSGKDNFLSKLQDIFMGSFSPLINFEKHKYKTEIKQWSTLMPLEVDNLRNWIGVAFCNWKWPCWPDWPDDSHTGSQIKIENNKN